MTTVEMLQASPRATRLVAPVPEPSILSGVFDAAGVRACRGLRIVTVAEAELPPLRATFEEGFLRRCAAQGIRPTARRRAAERHRFGRSPLLLVAGLRHRPTDRTPLVEWVADGAACVERTVIGLRAEGYDAQRRTGSAAYDPAVKAALGFRESDVVLAFVDVGTRPG